MRTRLAGALLCLALWCGPGQAATYHINALDGGVFGGSSGHVEYHSPLYTFAPGDIVDFGSVTLSPFRVSGQGFSSIYIGQYDFSFGAIGPVFPDLVCHLCSGVELPDPQTYALLFTLPSNSSQIQIGFAGGGTFQTPVGFQYTPPSPIPLPGALPLFATVLGLAGWFAWRRKPMIQIGACVA